MAAPAADKIDSDSDLESLKSGKSAKSDLSENESGWESKVNCCLQYNTM